MSSISMSLTNISTGAGLSICQDNSNICIYRRVQKVVTHRNFDKFTYEYDIALLEMQSPVSFQPNIIPICLPSTDSSLVGQIGTVTGWGRLSEFGQISPVLREVKLPIISNSKCMRLYR